MVARKRKTNVEKMVDKYEDTVLKDINEKYNKETTTGDKVADKVASFGGSWRFIGIFSFFLLFWIAYNSIPFMKHFDPYPFILLNLCLSFVAAFQAPIIMMSQNRQAKKDKQEAIINYALEFQAEQEIKDIQEHLHRIEKKLDDLSKKH